MKKAYIISTGTELLTGMTTDTNAAYISKELTDLGLMVLGVSVAGDNRENLKNAFTFAFKSADIIIASGGLGPTKDDLTKEVACEVLGLEQFFNDGEVVKLKDFFAERGKEMPKANLKQALFPEGAKILANPLGTAPGLYLKKDEKLIVLLPGPPKEMKRMFIEEVKPRLVKEYNLNGNSAAKKTIKVLGIGESQVEEIISEVIENPLGCSIALIAEAGEILIKITAEGKDAEDSNRILDLVTKEIKQLLNPYIFGEDEDELEKIVADILKEQQKTLAVAESCTGGLIAKLLTDLPGSSAYFWGGVVSYSNEAKQELLGVASDTLTNFGAVSEETAIEMARAIKNLANTSLGLAVTGIAGPEGGSIEKPVGLVYISLASEQGVMVNEYNFVGDRDSIRTLTAKSGLDLIRKYINNGGI
ncbi:MAG: competence/damage-inducible protein A [Syntrophomonadaceae bacterium]|nr:competence/damage-inducible protein A [Syntrophomonadaceae bacterium]